MRIILKLRYGLIIALCVLSSCGGSKNLLMNKSSQDSWTAQEAKLFDIPILLDAQPEKALTQEELSPVTSVTYTAHASLKEALDFYEKEMEIYGWDNVTFFVTEEEALLIFEKPSKHCSVSLRLCKYQLKVVIFVKNKE